MTPRHTFVWAHGLASSMAHEDDQGLFDWSSLGVVARVARYDARGHGGAWTPCEERCYRWPALVDDMLRAGGQGPFVAGGASMGCVTALYAAVRAPRRVQALVLALPPPAWEARALQATAHCRDAQLLESGGIGSFVQRVRERPLPPILARGFPAVRDIDLRHVTSMSPSALPAILRGAAASDFPTRDEVRLVIVPTLILTWPDDPEHPLSAAEELAGLLLQADLRVARNMEDVRRWPGLVRDFLAGV